MFGEWSTGRTYCVCPGLSCSSACLCSPCWSGAPHSAMDWCHRPPQRMRWRTRVGGTRKKGWRRRKWRRSLMLTNVSCQGSGSCRPALAGPPCSGWNQRAKPGAAECPPCLRHKKRRKETSADAMWCRKASERLCITSRLYAALIRQNRSRNSHWWKEKNNKKKIKKSSDSQNE